MHGRVERQTRRSKGHSSADASDITHALEENRARFTGQMRTSHIFSNTPSTDPRINQVKCIKGRRIENSGNRTLPITIMPNSDSDSSSTSTINSSMEDCLATRLVCGDLPPRRKASRRLTIRQSAIPIGPKVAVSIRTEPTEPPPPILTAPSTAPCRPRRRPGFKIDIPAPLVNADARTSLGCTPFAEHAIVLSPASIMGDTPGGEGVKTRAPRFEAYSMDGSNGPQMNGGSIGQAKDTAAIWYTPPVRQFVRRASTPFPRHDPADWLTASDIENLNGEDTADEGT
ncbi:hypothetical protein BD324DRAFT_472143 [Kockovaella imperatae]|uniref:Uncharacterized protein n=1 Tax=Kockovaella imperatae TaxID=4999 RepID=A0A1Y1UIC3_9TREE|nr:hypothetical protein BD324DRAFT_472143 [Kockovaella imperatae]ORX36835.1 hypothetical protein BD324DRAFT_472143 [Kockovaella imperatae]